MGPKRKPKDDDDDQSDDDNNDDGDDNNDDADDEESDEDSNVAVTLEDSAGTVEYWGRRFNLKTSRDRYQITLLTFKDRKLKIGEFLSVYNDPKTSRSDHHLIKYKKGTTEDSEGEKEITYFVTRESDDDSEDDDSGDASSGDASSEDESGDEDNDDADDEKDSKSSTPPKKRKWSVWHKSKFNEFLVKGGVKHTPVEWAEYFGKAIGAIKKSKLGQFLNNVARDDLDEKITFKTFKGIWMDKRNKKIRKNAVTATWDPEERYYDVVFTDGADLPSEDKDDASDSDSDSDSEAVCEEDLSIDGSDMNTPAVWREKLNLKSFTPDSKTLEGYKLTMADFEKTKMRISRFLIIYNQPNTIREDKRLIRYKKTFLSIVDEAGKKEVVYTICKRKSENPKNVQFDTSTPLPASITNYLTFYHDKTWKNGKTYKMMSELKLTQDLLKTHPNANEFVIARFTIDTRIIDNAKIVEKLKRTRLWTWPIPSGTSFYLYYFKVGKNKQIEPNENIHLFKGSGSNLQSKLKELVSQIKSEGKSKDNKDEDESDEDEDEDDFKPAKRTISDDTKKTVKQWEKILYGKKSILKFGSPADKARAENNELVTFYVYANMNKRAGTKGEKTIAKPIVSVDMDEDDDSITFVPIKK